MSEECDYEENYNQGATTNDHVQNNTVDSDFDELDIPDSVAASNMADIPILDTKNENAVAGNCAVKYSNCISCKSS